MVATALSETWPLPPKEGENRTPHLCGCTTLQGKGVPPVSNLYLLELLLVAVASGCITCHPEGCGFIPFASIDHC